MDQPKANKMTVAGYVAERLKACGKSPAAVADEVDCSSMMVAAIAEGRAKLPVPKVILFATALEVDPIFLFRLVLGEYSAGTLEVIDQLRLIARE